MVFFKITASHFFIRITLYFLFLTVSPITGTRKYEGHSVYLLLHTQWKLNYKKSIVMTNNVLTKSSVIVSALKVTVHL
jgi:hypothetical protein